MAENFGLETSIHPQAPQIDPDSISAEDPEGLANAVQEILRFQNKLPRYADDLKDTLGRNFLAANAVINEALIFNLIVDTLKGRKVYLGEGQKFQLDGPNRRITIYDDQVPPVKRLEFGFFGVGAEVGLKGYDASGTLVFTLGAGLSDLVKEAVKESNLGGLGVELIYAVYNTEYTTETFPDRIKPLDSWGYNEATTVADIKWQTSTPDVSASNRFLYVSGRTTSGEPDDGAAVADTWSVPSIMSRWGPKGDAGAQGEEGEPGASIEYTYAKYSSDTLPANLYPSNSWGYLETGTIGEVDESTTFNFPATAFFGGGTVKVEPEHTSRPQITDNAFLPTGNPDRYYGNIILNSNGDFALHITPDRTGLAEASGPGHDLSSDFEGRGRITITLTDATASSNENVLQILMADSDPAEPYEFTPSNPGAVKAMYERYKNKQAEGTRYASTVTFDILSEEKTISWNNSKEGVKLDKTNTHLWQAGRIILGNPAVGSSISDDWSVPVITGVFGRDGKDGEDFDPDNIPDGSIRTKMLHDAAVDGNKLANTAVSGKHLAAASARAAILAGRVVGNAHLELDSVDAKILAAGAVAASHIEAGGLRAYEVLVDGSITAALLEAGIIKTKALFANNVKVIEGDNIEDGTIEAKHLKVGSIDADRISGDVRNVTVLWQNDSGIGVRSETSWSSFTGLKDDLTNYDQIQGVAKVVNRTPNIFAPWAIPVEQLATSASGDTRIGIIGGVHPNDSAVLSIRRSGTRSIYMRMTDDDEQAIIYDIIGIKNPGSTAGGGSSGTTPTPPPGQPSDPGPPPRDPDTGTVPVSTRLFSGTSSTIKPPRTSYLVPRQISPGVNDISISLSNSQNYNKYQITFADVYNSRVFATRNITLGSRFQVSISFVAQGAGTYSGDILYDLLRLTATKRESTLTLTNDYFQLNSQVYTGRNSDGSVDSSKQITLSYPFGAARLNGIYITAIYGINLTGGNYGNLNSI